MISIELKLSQAALDRRQFIGTSLAVAALPVTSLIPAGPAEATIGRPLQDGDWNIDDQWHGFPRYHEAIGYGRPAHGRPAYGRPVPGRPAQGRPEPAARPAIDPADEFFVEF